ncbi:MAG: NAD(P)/FAD-dependent oxidoreductase [Candidatus Heimdallarchaeota archaeon]|nr:NAD(P)/FAD-dependent oxidoreductase [Candidatus Heimdallarchaeota archaeon]MBY8993627.1 NAD(P)/FAD-dependent oxidoreductase [Candidatus Heimdallarchaeota archaeon]
MTKIIIIGGGLAGLSAGCYLQINGFDTEIFEMHDKPGGLCTSWSRKDFTFDGCIHFLFGSNAPNQFFDLWQEIVDLKALDIVDFDEYSRIVKGDKSLSLYSDPDKLRDAMLAIAPEDKAVIVEFTQAVRDYCDLYVPIEIAPELIGMKVGMKLLPKIKPFMKFNKVWNISTEEFVNRFTNPFLRATLADSFEGGYMSLISIITSLSMMSTRTAGYPIGGSLKFAKKIEESYLKLGGKINYKQEVKKILVEKDKAVGILLESGEKHKADLVISAADGHTTIFDMLDGKFVNKKIKNYYKDLDLFRSIVQVSLGINRTFDSHHHKYSLFLDEPIIIEGNNSVERLEVLVYSFDPTLAPQGKTSVVAAIETHNDEYWTNLRNSDRDKYRAEKDRISKEVIARLDAFFGDIKSNVEVVDVATPATYIRYTNNWKGRYMGFALTPKGLTTRMKKTLPGLKNFYMIGQWVQVGGGLPTGLMSGRNVTQVICKNDKREFKTS